MKWKDITTDHAANAHSRQFLDYYGAISNKTTLSDYLKGFEFESQQEIEDAIIELNYTIVLETTLSDKETRKLDPAFNLMKTQAEVALKVSGKLEKIAAATAADLWHKHFAPLRREKCFTKMFSERPKYAVFDKASELIMSIYGLDYADIEKLRFFVEQVKARDAFPPSLRRMLYIWGRTKKTGKTTCAKMMVSTLNGSECWDTADPDYTTTLANEMQIGGFKVPRIASLECCLMDECFYSDMGKTYHDFKRFLTSSGGTARLPYGQEFQWVGRPNYVATSNEPLSSFIKDWGDRRFLSIEFKSAPTEQLDFDEIHNLWKAFVVNSTPKTDNWQEWANEIASCSDEIGERKVLSDEYDVEMRKPQFLDWIISKPEGRSATSADNQLSLLNVINYFAETEGQDARKHRKEIEAAFIAVFGERESGYRFWRIDTLHRKAYELMNNNQVNDF